jgi:hypothetical protein
MERVGKSKSNGKCKSKMRGFFAALRMTKLCVGWIAAPHDKRALPLALIMGHPLSSSMG